MELKLFMTFVFVLGALGLLRGIKDLKRHSLKYLIPDSLFSLVFGTFQYSGVGRIVIGILLVVVAVIVIFQR